MHGFLMGSKPIPFLPSSCQSVLPVSRPHHGSHAHFPDGNPEAQRTNPEHGTQPAIRMGFQLLPVSAITSQVLKDSDFCLLLPRKPSPSERSASLDVHQSFQRTAPTMIPRWYIYLSDYAGGQCLDSLSTHFLICLCRSELKSSIMVIALQCFIILFGFALCILIQYWF